MDEKESLSNLKDHYQDDPSPPMPGSSEISEPLDSALSVLQSSITEESRNVDVTKDDLNLLNRSLQALHNQWPSATTVDETCKMVLTTIKLIETRRKILLLPYGENRNKPPERNTFDPFEDEETRPYEVN